MLKQADSLTQQGRYQEAVQAYDRVISMQPQKNVLIAAHYNKGVALQYLRRYEQAAQSNKKVVALNPNQNNGKVYGEMGRQYQMAQIYIQSKLAYEKYLARYPNDEQIQFNLGFVLENLQDFDKAIKCYQKAYQIKSDYMKPYLHKILLLKKLKKFEQILATCKKAKQEDPMNYQILYQQGEAYYNINDFKEALYSLKMSFQANNKHPKTQELLGIVYYKLEKYEQSLHIFDNCRKNNLFRKTEEKRQIIYRMGLVLMAMKKYPEAAQCLKELASTEPVNPNAKEKLSQCYQLHGNILFQKSCYSDSIQAYKKSLQFGKQRVSVLNNIGLAHLKINDTVAAEKYFDMALEVDPESPKAKNNKAMVHMKSGKLDLAECMIGIQEDAQSLINKGKFQMQKRKYEAAYQLFKKAEKLNPNKAYDLFNDMAVALQSLNRYEQALIYANRAVQRSNARSPLILANRASILMKLNKTSQAKKDMDRTKNIINQQDKGNLRQFGLDAMQLTYIFRQMDHYSNLITPIDTFRSQLAQDVQQHTQIAQHKNYPIIVGKVDKAEGYAVNQVLTQIVKTKDEQATKFIKQAATAMNNLHQQQKRNKETEAIHHVIREVQQLRASMIVMAEKVHRLQNTPNKQLQKKFEELERDGDIVIRTYGQQLYWMLLGYLQGYMSLATGIVGKGDNIDKSKGSEVLSTVGSALDYAKLVPVVGQVGQTISKLCGFFVGLQTDTVIQKLYEIISFNYGTKEQLSQAVCQSVLICLSDQAKIKKVRQNVIFKPSQGLIDSIKSTFAEIANWFKQKKDNIVTGMRGLEKTENAVQQELAVVDVGCIIAIMLNMQSDKSQRRPAVVNAMKRMLVQDQIQKMAEKSFNRDRSQSKNPNKVSSQSQLMALIQKLNQNGDLVLKNYAVKLYWIITGYFKGYSVLKTRQINANSGITQSSLGAALITVQNMPQFSQNLPNIGQFAQLMSRVCGLFMDLDGDDIATKLYDHMLRQYCNEQQINEDICQAVLMCISDGKKVIKLRSGQLFNPPCQFFNGKQQTFEEISHWFRIKKEEFVDYMRSLDTHNQLYRAQLAVIDAGSIIAILLNQRNKHKDLMPLSGCVHQMLVYDQVQTMIHASYKRDNQSLRVSQNTICTVMRVEIVYDNILLNNRGLIQTINNNPKARQLYLNVLNYEWWKQQALLRHLISQTRYEQIIEIIEKSKTNDSL